MSVSIAAIAKPTLPRLLMADDHHLILDALGAMLKSDFDVLAVANSKGLLAAVENFQPDVVVLDVNMPGADGFSTARKLLEARPDLPIVFLSMYTEPAYVEQAARVGAKAYLSKRVQAHELIAALQAVLAGQSLLNVTESTDSVAEPFFTKADLTARQREVLRLIALGSSAKDVANELNISVRTAEFHRAAIMQRLGLHSTAQMTRYAIANNLG